MNNWPKEEKKNEWIELRENNLCESFPQYFINEIYEMWAILLNGDIDNPHTAF